MASDVRASHGYLTNSDLPQWHMAVDWGLALKDDPLPTGVMIAPEIRDHARAAELDVFDHVVDKPANAQSGYMSIMAVAEVTPFERTLYAHSDVYAFGSPRNVFTRLEGAGFALQGELIAPESPEILYGLTVRRMTRAFPVDRYLKCQSGIIYFRKDLGQSMFRDCLELADAFLGAFQGVHGIIANKALNDEWVLGIIGGRRSAEIDLIGYPIPMAWENYGLTPMTRRTPLIHMTTLPSVALVAAWFKRIIRNRQNAGLDPYQSLPLWKHKLRKAALSERSWFAKRGPSAKWRRWARWSQALDKAMNTDSPAVYVDNLYRQEIRERTGRWANGEQRTYGDAKSLATVDGVALAQQCRIETHDKELLELGGGLRYAPGSWPGVARHDALSPAARTQHRRKGQWQPGIPENLPVADDRYDIVCAIDLLDQVMDLDLAIAELRRVLRPGGVLVVLTRVEHFPDFGEQHPLSWTFLRRGFSDFKMIHEAQYEMMGEHVVESLHRGRSFLMENRACRAGVLLVVYRKPGDATSC